MSDAAVPRAPGRVLPHERRPIRGRVEHRWPGLVARVARLSRFGLVGITGFGVNEGALAILVGRVGLHYIIGAVLATQVSSLWNFVLAETWVFREDVYHRPLWKRLAWFLALNNAALVLRGPILVGLTSFVGVNYLVSNLISLAVVTVLRFSVADVWIWSSPERSASRRRAPGSPAVTQTTEVVEIDMEAEADREAEFDVQAQAEANVAHDGEVGPGPAVVAGAAAPGRRRRRWNRIPSS